MLLGLFKHCGRNMKKSTKVLKYVVKNVTKNACPMCYFAITNLPKFQKMTFLIYISKNSHAESWFKWAKEVAPRGDNKHKFRVFPDN